MQSSQQVNDVPMGHAAPPHRSWLHGSRGWRRAGIVAMMRFFFACGRHAPWFVGFSEPFWMMMSKITCRRALRSGPRANARWLCGPDSTDAERERLVNGVLRSFYRFIYDISDAGVMSREAILRKISQIDGREHYDAIRQQRRGVILATAHLGSFEVGMAALRELEPHVHVVFQQDVFPAFDEIRQRLHRTLGVIDAPVEQGVNNWLSLCEALRRDEAVLIQADRVMPGQQGRPVPFLGGHIRMPMGAVKLAAITGAPILPVFSIREPDGRVRLAIESAIEVQSDDHAIGATNAPTSLLQLAAVIEKYVAAHPDQWLMLSRVWCEDDPAEQRHDQSNREGV